MDCTSTLPEVTTADDNRTKRSDRAGSRSDPGPPAGGRAEQRGTVDQLGPEAARRHEPSTEWERNEQERLPPRGTGGQDNQGRGRQQGPLPATPGNEEGPPASKEGVQSGGMRGPSNENR